MGGRRGGGMGMGYCDGRGGGASTPDVLVNGCVAKGSKLSKSGERGIVLSVRMSEGKVGRFGARGEICGFINVGIASPPRGGQEDGDQD